MSMAQEIVTDATYNVTYATQYVFTSVVFNCSGAITGWSILAIDGSGGARPEISVWRPQSGSSEYSKYVRQNFIIIILLLNLISRPQSFCLRC